MAGVPKLIKGGFHQDERGTVSFVNDFRLDEVKRLYVLDQHDTDIVRAWQGHKNEQKWFYAAAGSFKVVLVKIDNWDAPSIFLPSTEFILAADSPNVLHIPGGYANGFKALKSNSKMIVFSDFTVDQSKGDDYRYDSNKWFNWE